MQFRPENYEATIKVLFVDGDEVVRAPSSLSVSVTDLAGNEITTFGPITPDNSAEFQEITIPAASNVVADGLVQDLRSVTAVLTYDEGVITKTYTYAITKPISLEVMDNSFMSLGEAEIVGSSFVKKPGWNASTDDNKKSALIQAFVRITKIPMKYEERDEDGKIVRDCDIFIPKDLWIEMTSEEFSELPADLIRSLKRAQLVEANSILTGDVLGEKRRAGIISEAIGESSVKFSNSQIEFGVSPSTISEISGYIDFTVRLRRT